MSAPARRRHVVRDCHDNGDDWDGYAAIAAAAGIPLGEAPALDPTPVADLEAWHASYDPAAATELDDQLDKTFGGA